MRWDARSGRSPRARSVRMSRRSPTQEITCHSRNLGSARATHRVHRIDSTSVPAGSPRLCRARRRGRHARGGFSRERGARRARPRGRLALTRHGVDCQTGAVRSTFSATMVFLKDGVMTGAGVPPGSSPALGGPGSASGSVIAGRGISTFTSRRATMTRAALQRHDRRDRPPRPRRSWPRLLLPVVAPLPRYRGRPAVRHVWGRTATRFE